MRRVILSYKNMRLMFFLVPFMLLIFLPITTNGILMANRLEDVALQQIIKLVKDLVPLLVAWWPVMLLREYIEGDGREVLYSYELVYKSKLPEVLLAMVMYMATSTTYFVYLQNALEKPENIAAVWPLFLSLIPAMILYCAMVFFASYLFSSTLFGLMSALLLYILNSYVLGTAADVAYTFSDIINTQQILYLVCSIVLFTAGYFLSRRLKVKS